MAIFRGFLVLMTFLFLSPVAQAEVMDCAVPKAPEVNIKISTDDVEYVYNKSSKELAAYKNETGGPAMGADAATGGLRADTPQIKSQVAWKLKVRGDKKWACMWYDVVTISIELDPTIYVASEFSEPECRSEILRHEQSHVNVDRIVMNEFAARVGQAVTDVINQDGAMGPFSYDKIEMMKSGSIQRIDLVIDREKKIMESEMHQRQSIIDSMDEYRRISAVCRGTQLDE